MKESDLVRKIIKHLNNLEECFFFKHHGSMYSKAGVSDLIGTCRGRAVALEVKVGKNKATPIQMEFLNRWEKAGGIGAVVFSLEDAMNVITSLP